ncbi:hypothetical protein HHK36_028931 [Tetracentron sinense]|uniref:Uncharacterized protein n=1 Tax=Tetracentron sinense TaxID=13715 RepID=A0A835D331_TETSI|nr:hypothetical protein HHK36_028931 [Tetracentron sinense]
MANSLSYITGGITCEKLPTDFCVFSVSSDGTRCMLERYMVDTRVKYECRSSDALVEGMVDWEETDECIEACGLERKSVGISSDSLGTSIHPKALLTKLLPFVPQHCLYLPKLCQMQRSESRRGMVEIKSSSAECEEVEGPIAPVLEPSQVPGPSPADSPIYFDPPLVMDGSSLAESPIYFDAPLVMVEGPSPADSPIYFDSPLVIVDGPSPANLPIYLDPPLVIVDGPSSDELPPSPPAPYWNRKL